MSSVILHATMITHFPLIFSAQPFSIEQGHSFAKWLSRTDEALTHLHGAIAQPFYNFAKSFFYCYTTKLFFITHCSVIFHYYSAQSFYYSSQTFLISSVILHATVLSHFPLIFSAQPFFIEQGHSFVK
jgi:hypothetical protein